MASYRVTAAMVRVPVEQTYVLLGRGASLPAGVGDETIERLLAKGMISALPEVEDAAADAFEAMTVEQLRKYAEDQQIDLQGATKKADLLLVITAAAN